jgi:hypothetical protein
MPLILSFIGFVIISKIVISNIIISNIVISSNIIISNIVKVVVSSKLIENKHSSFFCVSVGDAKKRFMTSSRVCRPLRPRPIRLRDPRQVHHHRQEELQTGEDLAPQLRKLTLRIMTLSILTLSLMTLSMTILGLKILSIMILSIIVLRHSI